MQKNVQKETEINWKDYLINPSSERGILSICLKTPSKVLEVQEQGVEAIHFSVPAHKFIYVAIMYLYSKSQTPSPIAIQEVITSETGKSALEEVGGLEYISSLCDSRISEGSLKILCQKLLQTYTRKEVCNICEETKIKMLDNSSEELNPLELTSVLENRVSDLQSALSNTEDVFKMGDGLEELLEERANNPQQIPGLETGWTKFDGLTGGLRNDDLVFVCARSKTGKSVILTNWAVELAIRQRIPLLYIDTEMTSEQQQDRILSILSGVPHSEVVSGLFNIDTVNGTAIEKREKIQNAIRLIREGSYFHIYMPNYNLERIVSITKRFKLRYNIGVLFFDYLKLTYNQAMNTRQAQEYQMLGFVASGLKDLGGTLGIPVVSACQENRSNPKSTSKDETNVGGSDRILQNASKLIFLYNKDEEQIYKEGIQNGNQQLYIAYQRNGECDCEPINVMFDRPRITMKEV